MTHDYLSERGVELLTEVAVWLEAGAPHKKGVTKFDMDHGVMFFVPDEVADKFTEEALTDVQEAELVNQCGTACCIAGAVVQFNQPFGKESFDLDALLAHGEDEVAFFPGEDDDDVISRAAELLGVNTRGGMDALEELFTMYPDGVDKHPQLAAKVVRHFLETGVVDWDFIEDELYALSEEF